MPLPTRRPKMQRPKVNLAGILRREDSTSSLANRRGGYPSIVDRRTPVVYVLDGKALRVVAIEDKAVRRHNKLSMVRLVKLRSRVAIKGGKVADPDVVDAAFKAEVDTLIQENAELLRRLAL